MYHLFQIGHVNVCAQMLRICTSYADASFMQLSPAATIPLYCISISNSDPFSLLLTLVSNVNMLTLLWCVSSLP